jgi:hypothetical protein
MNKNACAGLLIAMIQAVSVLAASLGLRAAKSKPAKTSPLNLPSKNHAAMDAAQAEFAQAKALIEQERAEIRAIASDKSISKANRTLSIKMIQKNYSDKIVAAIRRSRAANNKNTSRRKI